MYLLNEGPVSLFFGAAVISEVAFKFWQAGVDAAGFHMIDVNYPNLSQYAAQLRWLFY